MPSFLNELDGNVDRGGNQFFVFVSIAVDRFWLCYGAECCAWERDKLASFNAEEFVASSVRTLPNRLWHLDEL